MARSTFFQIRVLVLLAVLVIVLVYAGYDIWDRQRRTTWSRPLHVAVILLHVGPHGSATEAALNLMQQRVGALEKKLLSELERYRPSAEPLLRFSAFGPVAVLRPPPQVASDSLWDAAVHSFTLWRYTRAVDAAAQVSSRGFDSRIYVLAEPVQSELRKVVEGFSQQGGRVGVARVELDVSTVDLGLFVVAHELMHTLGASDKYGPDGSALLPMGLGDPEQAPLYPQSRAELMARNRVLSPGQETIPTSLSELSVGRWTAEEIGWVAP
jgi:hypothetical protein